MPARTQRKNTTARGLGWAHQQQVAALKRGLVDGTQCWWCGHGMYRGQDLHGDHSVPRAHGGVVADRLLHARCNDERGDGSRDDQRPALTGQPVAERVDDRAQWCVMAGW